MPSKGKLNGTAVASEVEGLGTQAFLAAIVESSDDAIYGKTLQGVILSWNHGAERMYGYTASEVMGRPVSILVPPGSPDEVPQILERLKRGERVDHFETRRVRKSGEAFDVSLSISPVRDASGRIVGASTVSRDISARKEAGQYARSLIEASLDPLVTISAEGKITDVNEATIRVTGVPRDKLLGTDFSNYFTEPEQARAGYRQVFDKGFVTDYALTIRHASGKLTHVLYNASVYKDAKGGVLGVFAAARDITAQKQASEYARSLIEASLDPLVTISPEGKITDVNEATIRVTGLAREKLVGTDFSNYFTGPEQARAGYRQVFAKGFVTDYPLTIRHVDGHLADVLYNASVYKDAGGNVLGVFAAARDITAQKQASEYARSLIEASLDPLVTISPEGKITDVNEATMKVTGVPREKLIGTDFANYFTEPEKAREGYQRVFSEGSVTDYPLTIRHSTGRSTDVLYNAAVYKDGEGNVLGVFAAARDITEQKRLREVLTQRAKEILEVSTPVLQVWEGVVVVPLIGTLDTQRAQQFMERLLDRIVETNSSVALLDVTGVPAVDTRTAQHLIETITSVRLLGAQAILTGVRPAIAQTLAHLGINLADVVTRSSLAAGLRVALDLLNLKVSAQDGRV